ncbi:MAG: histidine phosphatase family protein [Parvibaculum sp.]|nr:histidine phosphatase family protein [Parvibaculum sp.]
MSAAPRTDWIWIRHAPVQGQEARYFGQLDVSAEPVHPAVAGALARRLPPVAVWLGSPLVRARMLSLALREGVDPIAIPDFNEQNYGLWQGRTHNDVYTSNRTLDWGDVSAIRPPEGESFADVCVRVGAAIDRLSLHYEGHSIVALGHQTTVRAAIAHALGLDAATAMRFDVAPLSMTRLTHRQVNGSTQWSVGGLNAEFGLT